MQAVIQHKIAQSYFIYYFCLFYLTYLFSLLGRKIVYTRDLSCYFN